MRPLLCGEERLRVRRKTTAVVVMGAAWDLPLVRRAGEHPGAAPGLDCGYPSASQSVADTGDRTSATTGAISLARTQTPRAVTCSFERERNAHVQANHRSRARRYPGGAIFPSNPQ